MQAIVYYISLPFIYLISLLPFPLLYLFSDLIYVLLFKIIGYRKKVVLTNLKNSFPEKSDAEINLIATKFYKYFCDLTLETIKTLTVSPSALRKHVFFEDVSLFKKYYDEKKSVIIVMGHYGNWELGGARFGVENLHTLFVIYHPLNNKYFDKLVYKMRTRLGNKLYSMNETLRGMVRDRNNLTATAFIADQTPSQLNVYWTTFLNQDTPVFTGPEKIARKFNYPVIYVSVKRPKRGLYKVENQLLAEEPEKTTDNEISEKFTRFLEKDIILQPEIWLWTHRRWKHKRPTK
ncbi:MAG: lysophospholipid acyltransferase family protein [Bacteroidia bacterium]